MQVFKSNSPSLALLKREHGEIAAEAMVYAMLAEIEVFYGVDAMNAEQLSSLCELIVKNFHYLKTSDLKLFADKFKMGEFGIIYNRIDGGTIIEALNKYIDERAEEAQIKQEIDQSYTRQESKMIDPEVAQAMANIFMSSKIKTEEKEKPFASIKDYAIAQGKTMQEAHDMLERKAEAQYTKSGIDMLFKDYLVWYKQTFLFEINRLRS